MRYKDLLIDTNAYRVIERDKKAGNLSHAYLLFCQDEYNLKEYLKVLAELIMCESDGICGKCRACVLIDKEIYVDCDFYPKADKKIKVDDANEIVEKSYIKPLENKKRLFVVCDVRNMADIAQNKLLKTLEEPPENVCLLLGSTSEQSVLPTIKSRSKKIYIPEFSQEKLLNFFGNDYPDKDKLKVAVSSSGGCAGKAEKLYKDKKFSEIVELCFDIIINMKSSRDAVFFAAKVIALKNNVQEFLSVLKLVYRDVLMVKTGKTKYIVNSNKIRELESCATDIDEGAILGIINIINQKERNANLNANATMLADSLLLGVLEEKYVWQKL